MEPKSTSNELKLSIRTLTGQQIPIDLTEPMPTTLTLKSAIERARGIPVNHQRLIFAGRELQDDATLASYDIHNECAVHLLLRRVEGTTDADSTPIRAQGMADYTGQDGGLPVAIPVGGMGMGMGGMGMMPMMGLMNPAQTERLMTVHRLGRAVKLFAIIDGIFLLIFALEWWPLAIAVILPICGYYGAQLYRRCYIYLYMFYLILTIGLRIYFMTRATQVVWTLIFVVGVIIELYIMKIVYRFDQMIKDLTPEEKQELYFLQYPHRRMGI